VRQKPAAPALLPTSYEVEMAPGLEEIAYQEIRQQLGKQLYRLQPLAEQPTRGAIRFRCRPTGGSMLPRVLQLNTIFSAYLVLPFAVSRPKSLLAHEHFTTLVAALQQVRQHFPPGHFANFGLSAAGADSAVFQQLTGQLQTALNLPFASEAVDLLLRIRPAPGNAGWEVLIRLTPRPLSVRGWRVADMKGALNAAVAHAMVRLTRPTAEDKFLNLACGSGTLLIERLLAAPARRVIGCDIDARALQYAEQNLKAAQLHAVVELYDWNAHSLNLPTGYVDAICADLPFGIAVGAHEQNVIDYPQILAEAARVAKPRASFVLITQEVTLLEGLLEESPSWKVIEQIKVDLRGLHPRIFVLQRST
jgi:23S rRNA G2445 N2-methylase RlmL